jgi:predicted dehydrogenase
MNHHVRRREFLKAGVAIATFGASLGKISAAPNSRLRTAHVGVGGMGRADLNSVSSHPKVEVAAVCDVDRARLNDAHARHPNAKTFCDFREMISSLGDSIDAVVVSTPDHTHAPAAMTAMNHKKPVYCQKPLTHEVFEARQLRLVAERDGLPTQMGIQVHSSATYRRAVAMIQSGVIGKVSRVYAWSSKNWGYDGGPFEGEHPVPETLNWDLWLGTAKERPFHPRVYHPGMWRKLIDFGTGTLGDMGVHIFDTPYAALELTAPKWAKTTCRKPTGIGHPEKNTVEYEFPGTQYTTESLLWTWFDGNGASDNVKHPLLPESSRVPSQGSLFVGEEGVLLLPHVAEAQLFPQEKFSGYTPPAVTSGNHYHEWVDACFGETETSASFSYAGPLTEALLLGVVANRFPETKLMWDAAQLKVTNLPEANELLKRTYRAGFEVDQLG